MKREYNREELERMSPKELERLAERGKCAGRLAAIGERHNAKPYETNEQLIRRAANAGDAEALEMLMSGVLWTKA